MVFADFIALRSTFKYNLVTGKKLYFIQKYFHKDAIALFYHVGFCTKKNVSGILERVHGVSAKTLEKIWMFSLGTVIKFNFG